MRRAGIFHAWYGVGLAILIAGAGCARQKPDLRDSNNVDRPPVTSPDYAQTTLPPNLAPTNFVVREEGRAYYVRISSQKGTPIEVYSRSATIAIPVKAWRELLEANHDQVLRTEVYVQNDGSRWTRFTPLECRIAPDPIDPYVAYRLIKPLYMLHDEMGIYQRDLTSFSEKPILLNRATGNNCINCHSFQNYNPDRMIFHMRAGPVGTSMILAYDGQVSKVDTQTAFNHATSYRSWHPNGEVIGFAFNTVKQVFHAVGETRDVYDRASDLLLYNVKTRAVTTSPRISGPERMETLPEWAPDGKYLYFCSGPGLDSVAGREHPYKLMKYDLMRISYDVPTDTWGEVEPVIKASEAGQSITHPKISPDGRYLLFCLAESTYFPLYRPESDLCLLDLQTGRFHKAENINSDRAEAYHCWSSNGRWVAFSSKRQDGQCTHLYLSYFDREGRFSKPFLLPQRDPQYESSRMIVYNIPEFIKGPVTIPSQTLIQAAWSKQPVKTQLDPKVAVRASKQGEETPYKSGRGN